MTSVRRSVEQTITRLAMRQLRERASVAGTPAARTDAAAALALLLDYTPATDPLAACGAAIEHKIGCVEVALPAAPAVADLLDGAPVHLSVIVTTLNELQMALDLGANEVSLAVGVVIEHEDFTPLLDHCVTLVHGSGATLKLDLTSEPLSVAALCRLASQAYDQGVDIIGVPANALAVVRASGCRDACFKVANVTSLDSARELLSAGAVRLGVSDPWALLDAAQS